jgi:hypothetical protein
LGITHLLFLAGERPAPTLQEEVVYDSLVHDLGGGQPAFSGYRLVDLSQAPPPPRAPLRVATIGVTGYGSGVFAVEHLNTNVYLLDVRLRVYAKPDSPLPQSVDEAREQRLDAIVVGAGSSIPSGWRKYVDRNFAHIWSVSGHYSLYVPRPPE